MILKDYKSDFKKVSVPPGLVEKTLHSMREAYDQKNSRKKRIPVFACGTATVCFILAFFLINFIQPQKIFSPEFLTSLTSNEVKREVLLKDGALLFHDVKENTSISLKPTYGIMGLQEEQWSLKKYWKYLGKNMTPVYIPKNLTLNSESVTVYTTGDQSIKFDKGFLSYKSADTQSLGIHISKGDLPIESLKNQSNNSEINSFPLFLAAEEENNRYYAQFMVDDVGIYIVSENISQEEFIRIIYQYFK